MDNNFCDLLDSSVSAIKDSININDDKKTIDKMLIAIRLLLKEIKFSNNLLKYYTDDDILRLCSKYSSFVIYIDKIYQETKDRLNPEDLNAEKNKN